MKEMRESKNAFGLHLDKASVEGPGAIGTIEIYNSKVILVYQPFFADIGRQTSDQECRNLATFAVSSTVGPKGLFLSPFLCERRSLTYSRLFIRRLHDFK